MVTGEFHGNSNSNRSWKNESNSNRSESNR